MNSSSYHQALGFIEKKNPSLALQLRLCCSHQKLNKAPQKPHCIKPTSSTLHLFLLGYSSYELSWCLEWLSKHENRQLIFFELTPFDFQPLLTQATSLSFIEHPRVHIFSLNTPNFWQQKSKKIDHFLSQPFEFFSSDNVESKTAEEIHERLISKSIDLNTYCAELLHTSPLFFQNATENLKLISKSTLADTFKHAFKGIPAFICAAGPSLNSTFESLKASSLEKALFFAGGRALSVLNDLQIEPHFGLGLDPYQEHLGTFRCNSYFELPFIYRLRTYFKCLKLSHNPLVYSPGSIGYPWVNWLENQLGIEAHKHQEGLNVVNFSLQIATFMGCNPIFLVGSDLAYHDISAYSSSIPDEQNLPPAFEINKEDYSLNRGYIKKNEKGQPIFTLWKWIEEARWMSQFAKAHPSTQFYNLSSDGLPIEGFKTLNLSQALEMCPNHSFDLRSQIHALIQQSKKRLPSVEKALKPLQELYESLKICQSLLIKKNQEDTLSQFEMNNEKAFKLILEPLDEIFDRLEPPFSKECLKRKAEFLKAKADQYLEILESFLAQFRAS